MLDLNSYRTAIFDCDGVILDSNALKSEAFATALAGEPEELIRDFLVYHQAHGGVSRYVKFRHFYESMKKDDDAEGKIQAALTRYATICRKGLLDCPEIPGVRDILKRLSDLGVASFVVTGGDEDEVKATFDARQLKACFHGILGSPATKAENMKRLKNDERLTLPGVYFGDAKSDYEAAADNGLDFVFVSSRSEWTEGAEFCRKRKIAVIRDFTEAIWNPK